LAVVKGLKYLAARKRIERYLVLSKTYCVEQEKIGQLHGPKHSTGKKLKGFTVRFLGYYPKITGSRLLAPLVVIIRRNTD
jgi:hypothetical protein